MRSVTFVVRPARLLCLLAVAATGALAAPTLSYEQILGQLTDLDRLTREYRGITGGQFSSWDRRSKDYWGANGDAGQYLRVEDNGEAVMMEADGPGCIYRIWSANPQGRLHIYLDGATTPSFDWDFNDLFSGNVAPFAKPLVWQRESRRASDCYLPIPYSKSIKICADARHGQYYAFDYLRFPADWTVPSFHLPLTTAEQAALDKAVDAWSNPGRDPKPKLAGQRTEARKLTLQPGQTVNLADLQGPGMVRAVRLKAASEQRYVWRKLVLRGVWDGAGWPQVLTPIGPFCGFDWTTADYGSVIAGCLNGQAYNYYPMPFRQSGRLELTSFLAKPADVEVEIEWAPVANLPEDTLYFFARWRSEPDSMTFDYPFLETAGRGHFVGVAMPIDHPLPGWWGEGDEMVWIDDDEFPSWIGTGSEDYFGDAWGIRYLPGGSWGCSSMEGHRTCNYRWHFMDLIPFSQRFRMTIENYGPNGRGPRGQYEYTSTAFWYQAEKVPPFDQLAGKTYLGGKEPDQAPARYDYDVRIFHDLTAADVRTYGLGMTFAAEGETLLADAVKAGQGRIVDDALLPYEFNRERAMQFDPVTAGQTLATFKLPVRETVVYYPTIFTAPEEGLADVTLELGGQRLEVLGHPTDRSVELRGLPLEQGEQEVKLVAVTAGRAVIDCIQLQPAQRANGAMEAEDMAVVSHQGGEQPKSSPPVRGASAGRLLQWAATGPDQSMTLRIDSKPEREYVLGVLPSRGPHGAVIQAFANGKPLGARLDLYAAEEQPNQSVWPLGMLPADAGEVELRVVGRNPQASGWEVDLDYFRWEPLIIHPDSAPDVWARVLRTRGCQYRIQNLGGPGEWVGGHHLWIQPCNKGGVVNIGVMIPNEGDYDLVVRYTTSWDYAIVTTTLDDQPLGQPVDTLSEQVRQTPPITLGRVHLTAGMHDLAFHADDKNPNSKGYLMGIDYVQVKAAE